jgi:hypothetical protein
MKSNQPQQQQQAPKIGATHPAAMVRLGFKEIGQILQPLPDSIKPIEEIGIYGTALPQEVYKARHETEPNVEQNLEMQM